MLIRMLAGFVLGLAWTAPARGQAVQQPVVDVFSVDTVVSVPDRGAAALGGIRQSASGRSTAGPLRSGTAWGQASAASSATTHVWIHDFEAMDAALLAEGRSEPIAPRTRADRARAYLATQHSSLPATRPVASSGSPAAPFRPASRNGGSARPVRAASSPSTRPAFSPSVTPLQYNLIR